MTNGDVLAAGIYSESQVRYFFFITAYSGSHDALIRVCDEAANVIIPKTRRPVPKHATRYGVPFTLIASQ